MIFFFIENVSYILIKKGRLNNALYGDNDDNEQDITTG